MSHTVYHELKSPELKAHMKTTGILYKGTQAEIVNMSKRVNELSAEVGKVYNGMANKTDLQKVKDAQKNLNHRMDNLALKMDLILSLLLPDDAKKGEKGAATKCSSPNVHQLLILA